MITDDLGYAFADFGQTVQGPSYSGQGILDMPDDLIGGDLMISTSYVLTVKTADFSAAKNGDTLSIGGTNYKVREIRKVDDGAFSKITLSKV